MLKLFATPAHTLRTPLDSGSRLVPRADLTAMPSPLAQAESRLRRVTLLGILCWAFEHIGALSGCSPWCWVRPSVF